MIRKVAKKHLWALGLAALAALPAGAQADGIPFAGVELGNEGVHAAGAGARYVTLPSHEETIVAAVNVDGGGVLRFRSLPGLWGVPMVAFDGSTDGLSHDGRTLVLAQPPIGRPRKVSRFPILGTEKLRLRDMVTLRGSFSFDALSPDGRTLYLIEHLSPKDVSIYRVRAFDVDRGRLLPKPIRDPKTGDTMHGYPLSRATSADGRWAYTLYQAAHHSFVHALDTVARRAACVDLPPDAPPDEVASARLLLGEEGRELVVRTSAGHVLAVIDTRTHELRPPERPQPARLRNVSPAGQPEQGMPWTLIGGGASALATAGLVLGLALWRVRMRLATAGAVRGS